MPEGLTFFKFWVILLTEVGASTSLLKFEISRRVGNWSLRRSEILEFFLCHLIHTLRRRFGRHDLSGILGADQIEFGERLTVMIRDKQVAYLVPCLVVFEAVALPLRKKLSSLSFLGKERSRCLFEKHENYLTEVIEDLFCSLALPPLLSLPLSF